MSTLAQLRTAVKETFKRTDKDTEIDRAINDAHKEMAFAVNYGNLEVQRWVPTVAGQEEYDLPNDILRINHPVRLIDPSANNSAGSSHPLTFIPKHEYDRFEPNPNASSVVTGEPWAYTIFDKCILLTGLPDKVYHIEFNFGGTLNLLSADVDTSIFQDHWDEVIKAGALARVYAGIQLYEDSQYWQGIYINGYSGGDGILAGGLKALKQSEDVTNRPIMHVRPNQI